MQFVGQTSRFLKTRFTVHYRRMKKPCKIDNFLHRPIKLTNHFSSLISIRLVEMNLYDDNSTKRIFSGNN